MRATRLGNMDLLLTINREELSKIENASKGGEILASSKIKSAYGLDGIEIKLIYDSERSPYSDNGLDCSEVVRHIKDPPIPVYITDYRVAQRLKNEELCISAFLQYKLEIKVE